MPKARLPGLVIDCRWAPIMGLTLSQRHAVTKTIATRYKRSNRTEKGTIPDELCATTGWHRNHARSALRLGRRRINGSRRGKQPAQDTLELFAVVAE